MDQILETRALLEALYQRVRQHLEQSGDYSSSFRAINNKVAICNKIFDSKDISFLSNEEGVEAMKLILRDFLFVATISVFEYNLLTISSHKKAPKTSLEIAKKISIRAVKFPELVSWLHKDNLLTSDSLWQFALKIRNDIVHFDSRARDTLSSPDVDVRVFVTEGEVISGELISFVRLIEKLEEDYYSLICQLRK